MQITMLPHKFKNGKKAVSNVIVVVLSLILIVVIVANVILWSYEMNQYDWERENEEIEITYVSQESPWNPVISEFSLTYGSRVSGNYFDTQTIDGTYESFAEEQVDTVPLGWFNASWRYRKPIIVNNTGNSAQLVDFQIPIIFNSASLISRGKMRNDCGDLRFTDINGTELNYWIESGVNSTNTKVWVKIPLIPADSLMSIYMYYGNPSATSKSNGTATFEFFDDFEDLSNWNLRGGLSTILTAENRTVVRITSGTSNPEGIYTKAFFNVTNRIIELELKGFGNSDLDAAVYVDTSWSSSYYGSPNINHFIGDNYNGNRHRLYLGGSSSPIGSEFLRSEWRIATLTVKTTEISGTYMSETLSLTGTASTYVGFIALQADNDGSPNTRYYYVDWILMRKHAEQTPLISIGAEEEPHAYRMDFEGSFRVDLDNYPLESIREIEISVTARASDASEEFSIKMYNWEEASFAEVENLVFAMDWSTVTLDLTENLSRYIHENGSLRLKIVDKTLDDLQTTLDLDFLAVRAVIDGFCIGLVNRGSLTTHIVSIWVINSTSHIRYDVDFFLNSGKAGVYVLLNARLPEGEYMLKIVTEKGNIAVYSTN